MGIVSICVLLGASSLQFLSHLPSVASVLSLCAVAAACLARKSTRPIAAFLVGFCLMWTAAKTQLDDRLDPSLAGTAQAFAGRIEDFPALNGDTHRFVFAPIDRPDLPARIRVAWYESAYSPSVGEVWHLELGLRRPRGLSNPGGFDFEGWLFRQHIGATAYVMENGQNYRVLSARPGLTSQIRQRFVDRVSRLLPTDSAAAVLIAIGVGARHRMQRQDWDNYAVTGTSHLMAISGLHIGLAAGSVFALSRLLLAVFRLHRSARDIALLAAVIAAGLYAQLSGLAIPAQRAVLMALLLGISFLLRFRISNSTLLSLAGLTIFLIDPLAILTPGFAMSFAAVAVIYVCLRSSCRPNEGFWTTSVVSKLWSLQVLWRLQFALMAGLFPLTVWLFDRVSPGAPVVNILILPVFNFITVPFCLFGLLLDGPFQNAGDQLLRWSHQSIGLVLILIEQVASIRSLQIETTLLSGVMSAVMLLPIVYVCLPVGWPGRKVALLAMIAVVVYRPPPPPENCFHYTVLDVGQGSATVLRTREHTLVFDTGPSFRGGGDVAETVLIPFLRRLGVAKIDSVIVSHADLDHAGGLGSLRNVIDVETVLAGEPLPGTEALSCQTGQNWSWEGVNFSILHPKNRLAWDGNNLSCVLLVSAESRKLLFTGDIESPVEMLLTYRSVLPSVDIVMVPHHGSKTSSSDVVVSALSPQLAIVSAGFGNRWGMPRNEVVARWKQTGAAFVSTATDGAISQLVCPGEATAAIVRQREKSRRYWHDGSPDGR